MLYLLCMLNITYLYVQDFIIVSTVWFHLKAALQQCKTIEK